MIRDYYKEMLILFNKDFHQLTELENSYLLLRPPGVTDTFKDELRIKKKNDWESLGFKVEIDKESGSLRYKEFSKNLFIFSFEYNLNLDDGRIKEAIQTGKKIYITLTNIVDLLKVGYSFDDIITIPKDAELYSRSSISYLNSDLDSALSDIREAININPYSDFFALYFQILLDLKKVEYFDEYINYYKINYSQIINNETLFKWLKLLLKTGDSEKLIKFIEELRIQLRTNPESEFMWENTIKKFEKNVTKIYEKAKNL